MWSWFLGNVVGLAVGGVTMAIVMVAVPSVYNWVKTEYAKAKAEVASMTVINKAVAEAKAHAEASAAHAEVAKNAALTAVTVIGAAPGPLATVTMPASATPAT